MSLASNYFSYPLIGPTSNYQDYLADGVNPTEILNYLFKKSFGFPNANPYNDYNNDAPASYNSEKNLTNNNIYGQFIPFASSSLYPLIQDASWSNPGYPDDNTTGVKYISSNYPYIAYYSNVKMTQAGIDSNSFFCGDGNNPIGTNFSKNSIPYTFGDFTYKPILYYSDGVRVFNFGNSNYGSWLLDADSGVLTFYDRINLAQYAVSALNPPRITFWRYEGLTGNSGIVNVGSY
jgi:hypothetical protein